MRFRPAILRYAPHCGIIMHTSLLPGGERSLFRAIQIQIKQTHKSPGENQINSSSFCAVKSACLYVSQSNGYIYIFFLTGTLVGQAIIQVVMSVPNNNDLSATPYPKQATRPFNIA